MESDVRSRILAVGGLAVVSGGVLMALVNATPTPLLPRDAPFGELAASMFSVGWIVLGLQLWSLAKTPGDSGNGFRA